MSRDRIEDPTRGHLEVAKWLIKLSQSEDFSLIDIHELEN